MAIPAFDFLNWKEIKFISIFDQCILYQLQKLQAVYLTYRRNVSSFFKLVIIIYDIKKYKEKEEHSPSCPVGLYFNIEMLSLVIHVDMKVVSIEGKMRSSC